MENKDTLSFKILQKPDTENGAKGILLCKLGKEDETITEHLHISCFDNKKYPYDEDKHLNIIKDALLKKT